MSDTLELVPGCFVKVLTMSSYFTLVMAGENAPQNVQAFLGDDAEFFLNQVEKFIPLSNSQRIDFLNFLKTKGL
ncbi:hypothetical protein [Citrobacter sp. AATXR]|uniref:hypothetical protein n=1 Tax=Citrobacter sp. AATXR TaxID=1779183 RepID=UPI000A668723|nr:hypothetical protein [Citrobacter sp. AATXR]